MKKYFFIFALCAIVPAQAMFKQIKNAPKLLGFMQIQQRHHKDGRCKFHTIKNEPKKDVVEVPFDFLERLINKRYNNPISLIADYLKDTTAQNVKFLQAYISCILNLNQQDHYGITLLMMAAAHGNLAIVNFLLQQRYIDINMQDNDGRTAIMWAAIYGHMPIVERLLDVPKINIKITDNMGRSVVGCLNNSPEKITQKIREQLLDRGVAEWRLENL